ncbi:MAG: T9SS type A sorting domain-containing protein [Bacteroidota bacterium]
MMTQAALRPTKHTEIKTTGYTSISKLVLVLGFLFLSGNAQPLLGQGTTPLPRMEISELDYLGAFRLPAGTFGASSMNYAEGPIAYNASRHTLFVVGHSHHQALAEFAIPELINASAITDLLIADAPMQAFTAILARVSNPQALDRIGGMVCIDTPSGRELLINGYEYYDAPADNSHSTLVIRDADNLATSDIEGFFSLYPDAAHVSGWMSPIPAAWQTQLGGSFLTGHASGIPIIGRASVGPSAFVFDPYQIVGSSTLPGTFETIQLMDFPLDHPLHADLYNEQRNNDIWTHLSRAVYGFIVPGTSTYMTIGYTGGHQSGVCYKCTQTDGTLCDGFCAPDVNDYAQYYWLWDVDDMVDVRDGFVPPHALRPYAYGSFPTPIQGPTPAISGATVDFDTGTLYMALRAADTQQGEFNNPPIIAAYALPVTSQSVSNESSEQLPDAFELSSAYPNPFHTATTFDIKLPQTTDVNIKIFDSLGRLMHVVHNGRLSGNQPHSFNLTPTDWPAGVYFVHVQTPNATRLLSVSHHP